MTYTFRVIVPSPDGHPAQEETEENKDHEMLCALRKMSQEKPRSKMRIGVFLLDLIGSGKTSFTLDEWMQHFGIGHASAWDDVRRALNMGIIYRQKELLANSGQCYHLARVMPVTKPNMRLSKKEKQYLLMLYQFFGKHSFIVSEFSKAAGLSKHRARTHLIDFHLSGFVACIPGSKTKPAIFTLLVDPGTNPELFPDKLPTETTEQDHVTTVSSGSCASIRPPMVAAAM